MSRRHCVLNCESKFVLFSLPKDTEQKNQWLNFIFSTIPQQYNKTLVLCSRHFTDDCFSNLGEFKAGFAKRLAIKDGSVPTLFGPTRISEPQPTLVALAVYLLPLNDPNKTTENNVVKVEGCSDEDLNICCQDTTAEARFIDGPGSSADRPSTDTDSTEASLHPNKRLRLSSSSASLEEANGENEEDAESSSERWHSTDEADDEPPHPDFTPVQAPGPKFMSKSCNSPVKFLHLFLRKYMLQTIVSYTNAYGTKCQRTGAQWDNICMKELESFIALIIFMGLFKCSSLQDYWRESEYFGLRFPGRIMSYQRFLSISNTLHLSSTNKDEENKNRKGTSAYEHLGKIQPLYQGVREACKTYFHPFQNITVNERMVPSQTGTGLGECTKNKSTRNGYKLFALSDCSTDYTWDFFIYEGKSCASQSQGLSYESVMALVDDNILGTGYKLFVDKFYSSAELFRDLLHKNVWACGPVWANRKGFPRTRVNSLPRNAPDGTMRWIRDNELLFVQWKDSQELQMCSTFHKAYGGDIVQRKVKRDDGSQAFLDIPVPASVLEYDRNMEALDPSTCISENFRLIHKPRKWYQSVFYHFLDIAVENAFILQEMTAKAMNKSAMTRRAFLEILILKLIAGAQVPSACTSAPTPTTRTPESSPVPSPASSSSSSSPALASASFHKPKYITQDNTAGGWKCELCHQETTVMCVTCDVMLCFQPKRDCFNDWHDKQGS